VSRIHACALALALVTAAAVGCATGSDPGTVEATPCRPLGEAVAGGAAPPGTPARRPVEMVFPGGADVPPQCDETAIPAEPGDEPEASPR
jgi:hypothetical protein